MECMNPARGDRRKVTEGIQYPFGMTSFGKNIYYTDWRRFGFFSSCELLHFYRRPKEIGTSRSSKSLFVLSIDARYLPRPVFV